MLHKPCVYILASKPYGTLYTGVTSNLAVRVDQHKRGEGGQFTKRYELHQLVWYEVHQSIEEAIAREKQIKFWKRKWKIELITTFNPDWRDLYEDLNA